MKEKIELTKMNLWNLLTWEKRQVLIKERGIKALGQKEVRDNRVVNDGVMEADLNVLIEKEGKQIEIISTEELLELLNLKAKKVIEVKEGKETDTKKVEVKSKEVVEKAKERDGKTTKLKTDVKKIKK